jgi:hypothetical protein
MHDASQPAVSLSADDGPAVEEIERVDAPSREAFITRHVRRRRPVILRGVTADWLPPECWTLERMATHYGSAHVIAAALAHGTLPDDSERGVVFERVRLGAFIASLAEPGTAGHYVMAPTWNFPDAFQRDYRVPTYCAGAAHLRAKVWVGKAGTVTPMHRDVPHNLHVHLTGRKRWLLFPPGASGMYPHGLLSGMPNFSPVDPERPDYVRHPRFRRITGLGAVVQPGETLFIPHGWWHHTRTLDDAVSMNFWWGGAVVRLAAFASTLFKRARGIRRDEWG